MTKNNVFEEIQELIQQIKNEYQEGVDFEFVAKDLIERSSGGVRIKIISPKLKKLCREKFSLPSSFSYYLDYEKGDQEGNDFYYRINETKNESYDTLDQIGGETYRIDGNEKPKKCEGCGKLTFYENGRIVRWDKKKETGKLPNPNIIGYFHPKCAKKYFADQEQPNQTKNPQIKEKLLRNLDKLCLDPDGYLAKNEYLKTDGAEDEYKKLFNLGWEEQKSWKNRYLKIIIAGEEIDLYDWDNTGNEYYEVKRELVKKIIQEISQNPSEWKIEQGKNENYVDKSLNQLVKHQPSGRRYWKLAINYYWGGNSNEREKYWAEIEALINGSSLPVDNQKINDLNLDKLKTIFQQHCIKKIVYKNGELTIEYKNEFNLVAEAVNNQEFQELKNYCQKHNKKEINWESLNKNSTTPNNDKLSQNKHLWWLVGGIAVGIVISGLFVFLLHRKKRKIN